MKKNDKLQLAKWAVSAAIKAGADQAAVDVSNSRDIETSVRDGQLDQLKESTQNSLSLTIYAANRYSSHSTNDIRKESLGKFISEAIAMTKYLTEDEFRTLPDPKYYEGRKDIDLGIVDSAYVDVTSEQRVQLARDLEEAARTRSDLVISCTSYYSDSTYGTAKVHSNGFEGVRDGTSFSAGAESTVKDGDKGRPSDWVWNTVRFLKDLPGSTEIGREATERALRKIGQEKIESGVYEMVVENRSASKLLGMMNSPMRARNLQQKNSFLDGKLGEKIASEKLTIIDDPHIIGGLGSRLYDGEGLTARKRTLIDKGVLKSYLIDCYYGKKLGLEPNGGSTSNVVFEYGNKSLDELVAVMTRGILVTGFIGGNSNDLTGDFSVGVIGLLVEDGKIIKPVNEMNLSGNLTELWNQLVEVGNDPYIYSSTRRPSFYFKDLSFSGI